MSAEYSATGFDLQWTARTHLGLRVGDLISCLQFTNAIAAVFTAPY